MGACQTACCGPDSQNIDTNQQISDRSQKPFSLANLFELTIKDEKQLRKIENLIEQGITTSQLCRTISVDPRATLTLLAKQDKSVADYEKLCVKDGELQFKTLDFGSLRYMGQARYLPVYANSEVSGAAESQGKGYRQQQGNDSVIDYVFEKCGYGKLIWQDGSSFEGYWINGQTMGLGVFRATGEGEEVYEGFWQSDRNTDLSVFRQNFGFDIQNDLDAIESQSDVTAMEKQNGKGIEVWSDGSYYHGFFQEGVKEGEGVYFWADGSKYSGIWSNDEMSGYGCFQWADGRYFQGQFLNGVMHGYGAYVWQDGRKYEGDYKYNKKHGNGTYTYSDGSQYRGEWVDGMQHGQGCIIDAEQQQEKKGTWQFGKLKEWTQL